VEVNFRHSVDERWMADSLQLQAPNLQRRKRLCPQHALDICLGVFQSSSEFTSEEKLPAFAREVKALVT